MDGPEQRRSRDGVTSAPPPEIAAEAAVWIARLHGPDRSPRMERECLEWQARSAAHRLAFERCTDVWEEVAGVRLADAYASSSSRASTDTSWTGRVGDAGSVKRSRGLFAMAFALLIAALGLSVHFWGNSDVYATKVGEQQLVVLDDGTRMTLNTDTRVRVELSRQLRSVNVLAGEALFEVAKDLRRPFIVRVAQSEVVAVGTVFDVQLGDSGAHTSDALVVTLLEGQVTVRAFSSEAGSGIAPAKPVLMQAGERMRLAKEGGRSMAPATQKIDRPRMDQVVAWRRNEAVFDDVSLRDAVAEMNRYNRTPIVLVGDASLAQLRVSGLYRTGDNASFAQAVALLHGLVVREQGGRLELASPQ